MDLDKEQNPFNPLLENSLVKVFRFDDVCCNANMELIYRMTDYLFERFPGCKILFGVSPLVHNDCGERVFPQILNAYSDHKKFYEVDTAFIPALSGERNITFAGHGLIHIDHRLLDYAAQEMSILVSCSLVKSKMFIPPFNKWNKDTEKICSENGISLIKFEDGWLCCEYNEYDPKHDLWYLHAREWDFISFKNWFSLI